MARPSRVIFWKDGEPVLLCRNIGNGRWEVVNGNWVLLLTDLVTLEGTVEKTKSTIKFDRMSTAPSGSLEDYNKILNEARGDIPVKFVTSVLERE